MTRFKIGDKVRRIKESFNGMTVGDIGTVVSVDINYKGEVLTLREYQNRSGRHDANYFELVEENTMEVTKENLNDHTIYVTTKGYGGLFSEGDELRLEYNDGSGCPKFKRLSDGTTQYWYLKDLYVYGQKPEPEVREVTLEEVAKEFGISVESLRIKE